MGTKQYDNATDLITLTRASGGTALRKISYGSEMVTNGTFDTDTTGWTPNNIVSVDTQRLKLETESANAWSYTYHPVTVTIGQTYRFRASSTDGTATRHRILLGTHFANGDIVKSGGATGTSGDKSVDITFIATTNIVYVALQNTDGVLGSYTFFDDISVKEVIFDEPDGTLQLFNHGNNVPRIEYNADGTVKGLLIEEARTNLLLYSEDFDVGGFNWIKSNATATASSEIAPDGATSAYELDMASNGVIRSVTGHSVSVGETYTASIWLKAGTVSTVQLVMLFSGSGLGWTLENLTLTNEWQRFYITKTVPSGTPDTVRMRLVALEAGSILAYGAQIEAGSFPTSYIKTTGASATRAADFASIPVDNFGYNNDAGSLVLDVQTPLANQLMLLSYFNSGISYENSRGFLKGNSAGNLIGNGFNYEVYDGRVTRLTLPSPLANSKSTKLGLSYKDNENDIGVRDGGTVISGAGRSPNPTTLHMAGRQNGVQSQCWIKSIKYYPRKLTDAQLQELTT